MDPLLVNDSSFSAANTFSEIWPFSVNDALQLPLNSSQDFGYSDHKYISSAAAEESTITEQTVGGRKRRALTSLNESYKMLSSSSSVNGLSKKKMKLTGSEEDNENGLRPEGETISGVGSKATEEKIHSEPPKDYIHVRARRGEATDRHSLAERARREKISERMKFLQDLVPGCNKIIGKALVLDEIINYVLSLQRQVEFLSMKLEVVNSDMSNGPKIGLFPSGELNTLPIEVQRTIFDQQENHEARGSQPDWLHIGIDGNFDRGA